MNRIEDIDRKAVSEDHERFVAELTEAGALPDPAWRDAFRQVPRHVFVPYFYDYSGVRISREHRPAAWLRGVHSDQALVTQRRGGEPASSSSQPSLMAAMLHDLEITDDSRVLEIGTGPGYNAALLAHRLGDSRVISVEVAPELSAAARAHLAEAGYAPRVITGDGALGWPEGAPYDRIIATCQVDSVPLAWLRQLGTDGIIVAPVGHATARLRRTGQDLAEGRFVRPAFFMPLRGRATLPPPTTPAEPAAGEHRASELPVGAAHDDAFRFLAGLLEPDLDWRVDLSPDHAATAVCVRAGDGSTALLYHDGTVTEAGPRPIWSRLEDIYRSCAEADHPAPERYGLSIAGRRQHLWLDSPTGPHWTLTEHS